MMNGEVTSSTSDGIVLIEPPDRDRVRVRAIALPAGSFGGGSQEEDYAERPPPRATGCGRSSLVVPLGNATISAMREVARSIVVQDDESLPARGARTRLLMEEEPDIASEEASSGWYHRQVQGIVRGMGTAKAARSRRNSEHQPPSAPEIAPQPVACAAPQPDIVISPSDQGPDKDA